MKKKILTIALTVIVFLSAVALGISSVFRIDTLSLSASVVTEEGRTQAEEIQAGLQTLYKRKNTFSLNKKAAEDFLKDYPYFRLLAFEKRYPDGLRVEIAEESETYAAAGEDGNYWILGGSGAIVDIRQTPQSKVDGADLVFLRGVTVSGETGSFPAAPRWESLLAFCQGMDSVLGGVRTNVTIVEVVEGEQPHFLVSMREGVKLYIYAPEKMAKEKGKKAVNKYLSLSDEERTKGKITVYDGDGEVFPLYE